MDIKKINILILVMAVSLMSVVPAFAGLKMGVFPRRNLASTLWFFTPLAQKLSQELGEEVELVVAENFKGFWKGVVTGEYDLVHFNQYQYLKSNREFGYRVIAANEELGSRTMTGSLSVRTDSGIESIEDLRGKAILFGGGRKAMASYIAPTAILKKHGMVAGKDYAEKFSKTPPGAAVGVFYKGADSAGTGNMVYGLSMISKVIDVQQMKTLVEGEPFVQLPWAVKGDMDAAKAKKIQAIMCSLKQYPAGQAILKSARVTDFFRVTDADFDKVREITRFALGETY